MESKIISKENIKPSSPTPHEKRIHKLSLIDQTIPPLFITIAFHYPNLSKNNTPLIPISQTTQTLKQSLSSTLTDFYPLAGTFTADLTTIDCNDNGPLFVVAKFDKTLSSAKDDEAHIRHLKPHAAVGPRPGAHILMIQSNHYECGGVVIAFLFYHNVVDGKSAAEFVKAWAAKARGLPTPEPAGPTFPFHSSFPADPKMRAEHHLSFAQRRYFKTGKIGTRRYVLDASALSARSARSPDGPTKFETLTALFWKCFMQAAACEAGAEPPVSFLTVSVDMRKRAEPRFPENSFGNFFWLGPASSPNDEPNRNVGKLAERVRSAVRKVDSGFVKAMGVEGGYRKKVEETWEEFPEKADYLVVTSWCNFGLYGVDFGLGRPVWISQCRGGVSDRAEEFLNVLWLMDTRDGDGVEAWLTVDERYVASFDDSEEIRALLKIDPSPLNVAGIVID